MHPKVLLPFLLLLSLSSAQSFNPTDLIFSLYLSSNLIYHIPSLTQCVFDLKLAQSNIETFINGTVQGWQDENPKEIANAIGTLVNYIDQTIIACGDAGLDTRNVLRKAVADVSNITFLEEAVQRVGAQLPTILQDADDAVNGIKTGNATQTGTALGEILRIFFNINKSYSGN
jgi:hypothetical protein